MSVEESWAALVDGLRRAGEQLADDTAGLDAAERADGFRSLLRALHNQLGRFEVDRDMPELAAFNGWREKFLMDNPDSRYWVADIRDDRRYRVTANTGASVFQSLTVYAGQGLDATAVARADSDDLHVGADGGFEVELSRDRPGTGDWLALPEGARALWVRYFHDGDTAARPGWCRIEPLGDIAPPPPVSPAPVERGLARLGAMMAALPGVFAAAVADDIARPNEVRHWSEMSAGAAFTEPGIHYVRGAWELGPDEALVIEGDVVACRYWNVMLYSRYLNSLDYRHRAVSRTGATARVVDGRYAFVVAARDPGDGRDWLDTEGRPFGLVVMRWLQPRREPALPQVRRVRLDALGAPL